jgi:hypothetical protein
MDKEATLARLQKIIQMRENQQKFMDKKITYEEYEKNEDIFAEKLNICEMLDAEMDHIKSEFINGNISKKNFHNKNEKIYKQAIKILS